MEIVWQMAQTNNNKIKKKLLIATDNFLPRIDGIAIFLSKIIPKLAKVYDITVISPKFGRFKASGFKHITIPLGKFHLGDYRSAKKDVSTIKKAINECDIVFTQTIGMIGFYALKYAKKKHKPVASFLHNIEWELVPMATKNKILRRILYPYTKFLAKRAYQRSNLLIVPSDGIMDIVSWQGIRTKKRVVNLGVDTDEFRPISELNEKELSQLNKLREDFSFNDKFIIGTHGRLALEKDLYTILRAYKWLKKKYPEIELLVLGKGVPEIQKKLESVPGVNVKFVQKEVWKYLPLMDIYITASLTETTSLATLEAMATGLPVISTPVGYIKEYITDNYNGLFFDKKDDYSLFKQIDLLKNNPSLRKNIGSRARKTVINSFQWDETVKGILSALEGI